MVRWRGQAEDRRCSGERQFEYFWSGVPGSDGSG